MAEQNKTLDRILDLAGALAVSVPALFPAGPVWLHVAAAAIAMTLGRAANKGLPVYSSMTSPFKDKRGQMVDPEDPK